MFGKRKNKDYDFSEDNVRDTYARDTLQYLQANGEAYRPGEVPKDNDDPFITTGAEAIRHAGEGNAPRTSPSDRQKPGNDPHTPYSDRQATDHGAGMPEQGLRPSDPFAEEEEMRSRPSKLSQYITWILSGNILSRAEVRKQYPYICFMALLTFLYITNIFNTQKLYRKQDRLTSQINELRSKSLTLSSIRMSATRQSAILKQLEERGIDLKESLSPPMIMER